MELFLGGILGGIVAGMGIMVVAVFRLSDGSCREWIGGQSHPSNLPDEIKALHQLVESLKELSESRARTIQILKDNTRSLEKIIDIQTQSMKAAGLPVGPPITKLDD